MKDKEEQVANPHPAHPTSAVRRLLLNFLLSSMLSIRPLITKACSSYCVAVSKCKTRLPTTASNQNSPIRTIEVLPA